jgi:hypothetical protein
MDSLATKYFQQYNLSFGHEYLHKVVGTYLLYIQNNFINRMNLGSLKKEEKNGKKGERASTIHKLKHAFDVLTTLLLGSFEELSQHMRQVILDISQRIAERYGNEARHTFVVGFFFLRFVCPALAMPNKYFDIEISPEMQKFCVVMSKILQAVANGQHVQTTDMSFTNEIILDQSQNLQLFLRLLLCDEMNSNESDLFENCRKLYYSKCRKYLRVCNPREGMKTCGMNEQPKPSLDCLKYFEAIFDKAPQRMMLMWKLEEKKESEDVVMEIMKEMKKEFCLKGGDDSMGERTRKEECVL